MLKNMMITLILLCAYLSTMIVFKQFGLEDALNLVLSSMLLGMTLKALVNQPVYLITVMLFLSVLFSVLQDLISIPIMISSVLFGHIAIHFLEVQKQKNLRAQRRPKDENREFLNE
ncbi:hypothetical protein G9F31_13360 [Acinetobacter sp. 187]|uniref:hypothetical protein n=1 Tax=Acinetobacter lanii TaxID=2715163 RepID=UPI00140A4DCB|nr:hypothetical protein [Acinetobacter lanii]NHC04734.1 hypothetical protein [Acinetobacter lanii]